MPLEPFEVGDIVHNAADEDSASYMEGVVVGLTPGPEGWYEVKWNDGNTWSEWQGDIEYVHAATQVTIFT